MTTEDDLKAAFTETGNQIKAVRKPNGGLNAWGYIPVAIIPKGGLLPTPLPATTGFVVELPD